MNFMERPIVLLNQNYYNFVHYLMLRTVIQVQLNTY